MKSDDFLIGYIKYLENFIIERTNINDSSVLYYDYIIMRYLTEDDFRNIAKNSEGL